MSDKGPRFRVLRLLLTMSLLTVSLLVSPAYGRVASGKAFPHDARSFAQCVNSRSTSTSYRFAGWKIARGTTAHLNMRSIPRGLRDVARTLQASFDRWKVTASVPRIKVVRDGRATRPSANRRDDIMFGPLKGRAIATTYTWRWTDGFVESDVVFNNKLPWFITSHEGDGCYESIPRWELGNIATHEFGHVYGLTHASKDRFETMNAFGYLGETLRRSLGKGDRAGIRALY
jgi:hypothetical protein